MINIFVSATAARSSGALSILNQFVEHIPYNSNITYYVFVDSSFVPILKERVVYVYINTSKWCDRILWDFYGIKRWSVNKKIKANIIISLQNTGVRYDKDIPQIIYFHNILVVSKYKWSFFSKSEFLFYLYEMIYPYFVSLYLRDTTHVIVQASFIKDLFSNRFLIKSDNIHVIQPEISINDSIEIRPYVYNDNFIHFIYPATSHKYKNHFLLVEALTYLRQITPALLYKIRIHLTVKREEYQSLYNIIKKCNLNEYFIFEGLLPYTQLIAMYKSSRALLFPSYIETVGLPLLEAASVGIPIIVSDLPYAHEAIDGYDGVNFVNYENSISWALALKEICINNKRYNPFTCLKKRDGWERFFVLMNSLKVI